MNKIVLLVTLLLALGIAIGYTVYTKPPSTAPGVTDLPDTSRTAPGERNGTISVSTDAGTIEINDVRSQPETVPAGTFMYAMNGLNKDGTAPFTMTFDERDMSVAVALLREPLGETRQQAEQHLLGRLGISEDELCSLFVYVGVPAEINSFYSNENLGLSFCPGAVQLP